MQASATLGHGDFDGSAVTNVRRIDIPSTALGGPLGWVGDNAFLIAPARGEAMIVRVDGAPAVHVAPDPAVDACTAAPTRRTCASSSPVLLGTNADGSLLYWSDVASWTTPGGRAVVRHGYFQTWLDGTHGTRLTGAAGRYGPPLASK